MDNGELVCTPIVINSVLHLKLKIVWDAMCHAILVPEPNRGVPVQ
jgi:hypothetical protein